MDIASTIVGCIMPSVMVPTYIVRETIFEERRDAVAAMRTCLVRYVMAKHGTDLITLSRENPLGMLKNNFIERCLGEL